MKQGDILIAKDGCKMNKGGKNALTIGKKYVVESVRGNEFFVTDDVKDVHWFNLSPRDDAYYGKWFMLPIQSPEIY